MARIRTFLAIDVGDDIRARLVALQEELATVAPEVNWVESENLHLTLFFLGEVAQRETIDICRAAQKAIATMPAFAMSIEGAGAFPNARRPRTLWVGVGAGLAEVRAVHDAIEPPLLELGNYRRETRAYAPHVTVGRVKGERDDDELSRALAKFTTWRAGEVTVKEVCVMSSVLGSDGPTYAVLGRAKLAK
ncbi:MAG: RNA 2',3'-cyclic phosphodiesterase [Planctomycetes bacterium]|nr:RNA 2',3'-cyclic phosphodiesterase [Planctomycetota bacterium]